MQKLWRSLLSTGGLLIVITLFITACTFKGCSSAGPGEQEPATVTETAAPSNTDGAETILIPGGTFWMGSADADANAADDEKPSHEVTLSPYYIYREEVTNAMYARCVAGGACIPVAKFETGPLSRVDDPEYADHPLVGADWNMALAYCTWANASLPTEAQWEFAARGTQGLIFPWGSEAPTCDRANMRDCLLPDDDVDTMLVGGLAGGSSPFGVVDMSGNAWEWVQDWYAADYYSQSPASNPVGPSSGDQKVARGGGWRSEGIQLRSAERTSSDPSRSYQDVGFRCVPGSLELPQDYAASPDSHTVPGAPDDLGNPDPGEWYKFGPVVVSCPDQNNAMHLDMGVSAYQPMIYSVIVNGSPFTCTYNDIIQILSCNGPIPANNDQLTYYDLEVHFGSNGPVLHTAPARPQNCGTQVPFSWWAGFNCFGDDPSVQINSGDPGVKVTYATVNGVNPLNCIEVGPGVSMCIGVIDGQPGDWKKIDFGFDNGLDFEQPAFLPVCAGDGTQFGYIPVFTCNGGVPAVSIYYDLPGVGLISANVEGSPMNCGKSGEGTYLCGPVGNPVPGELREITFCLENQVCYSGDDIILDCAGDGTQFGYIPVFTCNGGVPAVSIYYDLPGVGLTSANVEGSPMNCGKSGEGTYLCGPVGNPVPGELREITFCLENQVCYSGDDIILDCATPPVGEWNLFEMGCPGPDKIYFIMDTGLDWMVPGAEVTITATDEVTTYACVIDGMTPGRVVCSGDRPGAPGILKFCLQQPGAVYPTCTWVSAWPSFVPGIPTCEEPPPDTPACSTHSTETACLAANCKWAHYSSGAAYCTAP